MPIQYILEPPNEADPPEAGWPLIIFLHGTTERGSNLQKLTRRGPLAYQADGGRFSCYVAAPQCPATTTWNHLNAELPQWLDALLLTRPIDPDRITLTGFSLGGSGYLTGPTEVRIALRHSYLWRVLMFRMAGAIHAS